MATKFYSVRNAKNLSRGKIWKNGSEDDVQAAVIKYLSLQYPKAIFKSNYLDGVHLHPAIAGRAKKMGQKRAFPDLFIAEPRGQYHGLFVELKKEGFKLLRKDGNLISDTHVSEQANMLSELKERGYAANFACGFDTAKQIIDWYMNLT